jgi:uncharacterized membrane protein YfcA
LCGEGNTWLLEGSEGGVEDYSVHRLKPWANKGRFLARTTPRTGGNARVTKSCVNEKTDVACGWANGAQHATADRDKGAPEGGRYTAVSSLWSGIEEPWYNSGVSFHSAVFLFFAAAVGGGLNAVAGGGSFVAFPALLFTGVAPVAANATNTLALWIGVTASGGAYRKKLKLSKRVAVPLIATSVVGGIGGALLLIKTPAQTFLQVLPWLMLAATLLFTFGKHLTGKISAGVGQGASTKALTGASIFEFVVSIYGGYFGGGIGIMNLAMLAAMGMTDIHEMNALKVLLGAVINGVATVMFVVLGAIVWPQAMVMTVGATVGGYASAHYAQKLPQSWIRGLVIVVGFAMTGYFFVRAWR